MQAHLVILDFADDLQQTFRGVRAVACFQKLFGNSSRWG
jgi:hypothetical protein